MEAVRNQAASVFFGFTPKISERNGNSPTQNYPATENSNHYKIADSKGSHYLWRGFGARSPKSKSVGGS